MRTMLKVIANDNAKNSRLESWYKHIEETGMFLSSQLPPALSNRREQPLTIEMLCFDTPVRTEVFSQISQHSFVVAEDLTVLDFGQQEWTLPHMQILLRWCAPSLKRVMLCKLANASFSLEALRYLVDFLAKHAISIDALDIGTMHMSLPRVELLGRLCTDKSIALKKLDFGHSRWEMSHMKALMWSFAHKGYNLERVALSAIECPAVGLDLLIRHMLLISASVRVFSTGVTPLSDKAHELILKQLLRSEVQIHACVLSYQSFNTENSTLLAKVIACSTLRSLALMHCQWYQDALIWPDTLAGVAKLYLEFSDGVCYEPLLTVLTSRGYEVTKQADSAKRIWLERKS